MNVSELKFKYVMLVTVFIVVLGAGYFYRQPLLDFFKQIPWKPIIEEKKAVKSEQELQGQVSDIVKTKDFSGCEEVEDDLYRTVCSNNIALSLAKETGDIYYCQKIDDNLVLISDCERQIIFSKSIEKEDLNVCRGTQNQDIQKQCENIFYQQLAVKKGDINICSVVQVKEGRDACRDNYLVVKSFSKDPGNFKCSALVGVNIRLDCERIQEGFRAAAAGQGIANLNLCFDLRSGLFFNYCDSVLMR